MHASRALSGSPFAATHSPALAHIVDTLRHRQDCVLLQCWRPNDDIAEAPDAQEAADGPAPWREEEIVFLHWRLLQEIVHLADPEQPLVEKFDTLRWIFTEREKDTCAFSFAQCLRVVGCSPLSPAPYCGQLDVQELRDQIHARVRPWMTESLARLPQWVRAAVLDNPQWVQMQLARNPQWLNEQIMLADKQPSLFA